MAKTFNQITQAVITIGTVLIVDSFNLAFRWKHQKAIHFKDEYIRTIESLKKSYGAEQVIICSDWGSSSYRLGIFPEYKFERKLGREDQSEEDAAYFELFFKEFMNIIEYYKYETSYPVLRFQGVEADDLAAHIINNLSRYGFEKAWLISTDRDWDLLVSPNVSRFSYITRKEITYDNWHDHYAWLPEQHISIKCLMGDSGDSVPGVTKIGPKTAHKLVDEYGSALDIADLLPLPGKYVYIKNLNSFGSEAIQLNYQLMDLVTFCDDAIGTENIQQIESILNVE